MMRSTRRIRSLERGERAGRIPCHPAPDHIGGHQRRDLQAELANFPGEGRRIDGGKHPFQAPLREAPGQEEDVFHARESSFSRASSWASSSAGDPATRQKSMARRRSTLSSSIRLGRKVTQSCGDFVTTTGSVSHANTMPAMPSLPACANMLVGSVSLMPKAHLATVLLLAGAI